MGKAVLFARLAEGHAAGVTVVTPNRRLAQGLKAEFDALQADRGLGAWEDADILPLGAFVERLYEDALYADPAADLPRLLGDAQERVLWESILADSGLLAVPEAAAECAKAWRLANAWRIDGALEKFPGNEDTAAFARWAKEYRRRCAAENFIDGARLPDLAALKSGRRPKRLVAFGFDILPPQARDFLSSFECSFCVSGKKESRNGKASFPSARRELESAARWARARLEGGAKRIGVVVPELEKRRREVVRVFWHAMQPGAARPDADKRAMPFNLSLGEPLEGWPVAAAALQVLELAFHEPAFEAVSRLLRSPFIAGAEAESAARARLDARLRRRLGARVSLPKLIGEVGDCPVLRSLLEKVFSIAGARDLSPHDWARQFTALLEAAGFGRGRPLDSEEYQARAKFEEVLGEFSRLGLVSGRLGAREALAKLRRLCAETLFQPESPEAPVQVVGILESAGMPFDCLWVSGLTDSAWPLAARPNPFLPVALQKKAQIPEASAEGSLALDRRITEGWLGAADEVVFSWPEKEDDRDLAPSPLIVGVGRVDLNIPVSVSFRDSIFQSKKIETIPDGNAPAITSPDIKGGTRVLADQSACPFRAFARHRLGAQDLESPAEGLDAMQRGQLLHALMAGIWTELKSSSSLAGDLSRAIERAANHAVDESGLEGRFAELEKKRLEGIAREWLELEKDRAPFEIHSIEEKRTLSINGLNISGRIDRMDRLADGTHALFDYKTGSRLTPTMWMGERPEEPQLPLYAVSAKEEISAVAFARLRKGGTRMMGFSRAAKALPGVKEARDWPALFSGWKSILEALAASYAQGDARVDPKQGLATCRHCGLQPLCRVHERLSALDEPGEEDP